MEWKRRFTELCELVSPEIQDEFESRLDRFVDALAVETMLNSNARYVELQQQIDQLEADSPCAVCGHVNHFWDPTWE